MSSLPKIANTDRFIDAGETASGEIALTQLPRLAGCLPEGFDMEGVPPLVWSIRGARETTGRRALEISVRGGFPLECQRCLQSVSWKVSQRSTVLVAKTQDELIALDENSELEVVLCDKGIDAQTLIEDELLLSLPFAPTHEVCPNSVTETIA
jgi:uncharacterized protein